MCIISHVVRQIISKEWEQFCWESSAVLPDFVEDTQLGVDTFSFANSGLWEMLLVVCTAWLHVERVLLVSCWLQCTVLTVEIPNFWNFYSLAYLRKLQFHDCMFWIQYNHSSNSYHWSYQVSFNSFQNFYLFLILIVVVENPQLQFEPFRSGRDGQVGTGNWSVGNVGRIGNMSIIVSIAASECSLSGHVDRVR